MPSTNLVNQLPVLLFPPKGIISVETVPRKSRFTSVHRAPGSEPQIKQPPGKESANEGTGWRDESVPGQWIAAGRERDGGGDGDGDGGGDGDGDSWL